MIVLLKKLLESVESQLQTQKTSTGSSTPEKSPTMTEIEESEKSLTLEQEHLILLRKRIQSQDKIIHEMSKNIKLLSESLATATSVQNEIAKQVMFLTESIHNFQELIGGPQPSYKFFTGDEPEN